MNFKNKVIARVLTLAIAATTIMGNSALLAHAAENSEYWCIYTDTVEATTSVDKDKMLVMRRPVGSTNTNEYVKLESSDFFILPQGEKVEYTDELTVADIAAKEVLEVTLNDLENRESLWKPYNIVIPQIDGEGFLKGVTNQEVYICLKAVDSEVPFANYTTIVKEFNELKDEVAGYQDKISGYNTAVNYVINNTVYSEEQIQEIQDALADCEAALTQMRDKYATYTDVTTEEATALAKSITEYEGKAKDYKSQLSAAALYTETKKNLDSEFQIYLKKLERLAEQLITFDQSCDAVTIGYAGKNQYGQNAVYLNGEVCPYNESSLEVTTFTDDMGLEYTEKVYTATNESGESFKFYVRYDGVHVLNGDGTETVYADTLWICVTNLSNEIASFRHQIDTAYNDTTNLINNLHMAGYDIPDGVEDIDRNKEINIAVQNLIADYNNAREEYAKVKTAVLGDEYTEEDIAKMDIDTVLKNIANLYSDSETLAASLEKALTGKDVTKEEAQKLEKLLAQVTSMREQFATDGALLIDVKNALGVESEEDVLQAVRDLYKQVDNLKKTNEVLAKNNTNSLKSTSPSTVTGLSNRVATLTGTTSALGNRVNGITTSLKTVSDKAVTSGTTGTLVTPKSTVTSTLSTVKNNGTSSPTSVSSSLSDLKVTTKDGAVKKSSTTAPAGTKVEVASTDATKTAPDATDTSYGSFINKKEITPEDILAAPDLSASNSRSATSVTQEEVSIEGVETPETETAKKFNPLPIILLAVVVIGGVAFIIINKKKGEAPASGSAYDEFEDDDTEEEVVDEDEIEEDVSLEEIDEEDIELQPEG